MTREEMRKELRVGLEAELEVTSPVDVADACRQWNLLGYGPDAVDALLPAADEMLPEYISGDEQRLMDEAGVTTRDLMTWTVDFFEDTCT